MRTQLRSMLALAAVLAVGCQSSDPGFFRSESTGSDDSSIDQIPGGGSVQARGAATETITFEGFGNGAFLTEVYGDGGAGPVIMVGHNPDLGDVNAAIIFDSSNPLPAADDYDLGTPNETFTGPGIGEGGEMGQPYENGTALGNIAIVAENLVDADNDDHVDVPDDAVTPDRQTRFDFTAVGTGVVTIHEITIIDVEPIEDAATVTLFDAGMNELAMFSLPHTGDNGVSVESLGPTEGVAHMIATVNGSGGIDNIVFAPEVPEEPEGACRVTGGGHDQFDPLAGVQGRGRDDLNRYTFGGQAGASTGAQPQPYGEWTHHQQQGPDGSFVFHAGTASAPEGTEIDLITCSDAGSCQPARSAPHKQIDFEGVGTFRNIRDASAPLGDVVAGETYHWFDVHIEDLGEPGNSQGQGDGDGANCPAEGSAGAVADCGCPDFYHITIYAGVEAGAEPNRTDVIYEVYGYIDGGNLQIHPSLDG